MPNISLDISQKLYNDLVKSSSMKEMDIDKFIISVLTEKITLLKYGDLNDIMNKIELLGLDKTEKHLLVKTNRGDVSIKFKELDKFIPKDKKKPIEVKEMKQPHEQSEAVEENKVEQKETDNIDLIRVRQLRTF